MLRSLFIPLKLATDARGLEFVTNLDMTIDEVARRTLYEALGESRDAITKRLGDDPDEDGIVVGDETRLRQIITNLARFAISAFWWGSHLMRCIVMHASSRQQADDSRSLRNSSFLHHISLLT